MKNDKRARGGIRDLRYGGIADRYARDETFAERMREHDPTFTLKTAQEMDEIAMKAIANHEEKPMSWKERKEKCANTTRLRPSQQGGSDTVPVQSHPDFGRTFRAPRGNTASSSTDEGKSGAGKGKSYERSQPYDRWSDRSWTGWSYSSWQGRSGS
jgi:hypothetical protein